LRLNTSHIPSGVSGNLGVSGIPVLKKVNSVIKRLYIHPRWASSQKTGQGKKVHLSPPIPEIAIDMVRDLRICMKLTPSGNPPFNSKFKVAESYVTMWLRKFS
jgi:hypothetical protein